MIALYARVSTTEQSRETTSRQAPAAALGTDWGAPGVGAHGSELSRALAEMNDRGRDWCDCTAALDRKRDWKTRTSLRLTGRPLQPYDLKRIRAALAEIPS